MAALFDKALIDDTKAIGHIYYYDGCTTFKAE